MKLQNASVKEIKRIARGGSICLSGMLIIFWVLSRFRLAPFDYRVILSGVIGTLVAVGNFTLLCLTIQKAAETEDLKDRKARFQLSYNARLIAQAVWVVVAFLIPWLHPVAAAVPLLFPTAIVFALQQMGRLMMPDSRKNSSGAEADSMQSE